MTKQQVVIFNTILFYTVAMLMLTVWSNYKSDHNIDRIAGYLDASAKHSAESAEIGEQFFRGNFYDQELLKKMHMSNKEAAKQLDEARFLLSLQPAYSFAVLVDTILFFVGLVLTAGMFFHWRKS